MDELLAIFSFSRATLTQELLLGAAAVITLVGTRLCWSAPRRRMSVEERAKDGELTEEQARRRIWMIGWTGPAVTFVGVTLLTVVVFR